MSAETTTQIRIKKVPKTKPDAKENFEIIKDIKLPELKENEVLISSQYISVDPYLRGQMGNFYKTPTKQISSFSIAKVLKSNDKKYKKDDIVGGLFPWSTKTIVQSKQIISSIPPPLLDNYKPPSNDDNKNDDYKVDMNEINKIPQSYYLGSLGMPGATAYYGMITKGKLKKGTNTIYID